MPSISILLPTLNDGFRLGVQLQCILPQLTEDDELILLLDGSDDLTCEVAATFHQNADYAKVIKPYFNDTPSGVCSAYNQCADLATKDWILGCAGNDEVQEGALDAWARSLTLYPDARIMHGTILQDHEQNPRANLGFTKETQFITPEQMIQIARAKGWYMHGAATFIRRDCWGRGYVESHDYYADYFLWLINDFRWGCVDMTARISKVNYLKNSFSQKFYTNPDGHAAIEAAMKATFAEAQYDDVRAIGSAFAAATNWLMSDPTEVESIKARDMSIKARDKRLSELMQEQRMDDGNTAPVNKLDGLLDMINWMIARCAKVKNVVEVGSYRGVSGELLALHFPTVMSVDPYNGVPASVRKAIVNRMARYHQWGLLTMPWAEAAKVLHPDSFDLGYIDGDHTAPNPEQDILAMLPLIADGGYIAGHDYGNDQPDVAAAVDKIFGKPDAVFADTSWIVSIDRYRQNESRLANVTPKARAVNLALQVSYLDWPRLESLWDRVCEFGDLSGCVVECGCARGGSSLVLSAAIGYSCPEKSLLIYDTFEGLPPLEHGVDTSPGWTEQMYNDVVGSAFGGIDMVVANCKRGYPGIDVQTFKGLYEKTLPKYDGGPICLLHADADWKYSTLEILENLWHHVVPGGVIIFDDYHFWDGCKAAVDEFFASRNDKPVWNKVSCSVWGVKHSPTITNAKE